MNLILKNMQSPGDIMMITACVRDLKKWYPDFQIDVRTSCDPIWENNPYITSLRSCDAQVLEIEYPLIHESNQRKDIHFLHGFIAHINDKFGLSPQVKLTEFKPDLHLTQEEKEKKLENEPDEPFWVVVPGGKSDFPHKVMWKERWQDVVDQLDDIPLVLSGAKDGGHFHFDLQGDQITNMIGKTNMRELFGLISRSVGVLSHVTLHMHAAMGLDVKAVTIAGGLEPISWEGYPGINHKYIHTIGDLDCCKNDACWKLKNCNNLKDKKQQCFQEIEPSYVAGCVRRFHEEHQLLSSMDT